MGAGRRSAKGAHKRPSRVYTRRRTAQRDLVLMRPRSGERTEPWLLIKSDDQFARDRGDREITDEEATSHISGRTNEELAATGELRKDHAARVGAAKAR